MTPISSTPILCTVHLHAGTVSERLVETQSQVSLYAGRYRIDKLEVLGFGHISEHELEQAYEQIVETARATRSVKDDAREDLRNYP